MKMKFPSSEIIENESAGIRIFFSIIIIRTQKILTTAIDEDLTRGGKNACCNVT